MKTPNEYRIRAGVFGSDDSDGCNGAFAIPFRSFMLTVIASDGLGWEHVSVSLKNRCPNWDEMSFIKRLFWGDDETVIQFHPRRAEYVNNWPNCLHLWKRAGVDHELPPAILTGIKEINVGNPDTVVEDDKGV